MKPNQPLPERSGGAPAKAAYELGILDHEVCIPWRPFFSASSISMACRKYAGTAGSRQSQVPPGFVQISRFYQDAIAHQPAHRVADDSRQEHAAGKQRPSSSDSICKTMEKKRKQPC